jgi:methylmalonyl-CoA mutase C-terminal domain/subunit
VVTAGEAVGRDPRLAGRKAVVAKLGMDAHWRGVIVVAHALRDAGMEVVYLGHATPDQLVTAVVQEDPSLVGLSSLSGNHLDECRTVLDGLRAAGAEGVPVVLGGTVPPADEPALATMGVSAVFGSGSSLRTIVSRIADLLDD